MKRNKIKIEGNILMHKIFLNDGSPWKGTLTYICILFLLLSKIFQGLPFKRKVKVPSALMAVSFLNNKMKDKCE